ncbi:hypothetical protein ACHAXT_009302 [Thalassiosira profunda]
MDHHCDAEAIAVVAQAIAPPAGRIMMSPAEGRRKSRRFVAKLAFACTAGSVVALVALAALFSEWRAGDVLPNYGRVGGAERLWDSANFAEVTQQHVHRRKLDEDANNNDNGEAVANDGDYSSYRCDDIFTNTPSPSEDNNSPTKRCQYATTCEGNGVLLPFTFCNTSLLSTFGWLVLLSPILLLALTLLFRLLGSTAEEYFSPSLEMFSVQLGLPPRFAGVTLLALGNGAADVSATMNAIGSDPENGYKMSLGALTGAAMFIATVVAGSVILANGGVVCRGALVRDVAALGVTVVVVGLKLEGGEVGAGTESLFVSLYVAFVLIVLVADVYHRAVMLPRMRQDTELREHQRQLDAERAATARAGDALNAFAGSSAVSLDGGAVPLEDKAASSASLEQTGDTEMVPSDDRTHATAPPQMEDAAAPAAKSPIKNRALNAVLTALSNYNDDEALDDDDISGGPRRRADGWGVECSVEGSREWDRPVVLHGADGILTRHPHHHSQEEGEGADFQSPYRVMEDMDVADRFCVQEGSLGHPAYNWTGAWHDGKQELAVHFRECWSDIVDGDEIGKLEKFLLICEFPLTVGRKVTVSIPCEGSYCRALVALSFALSPLWLGYYFWSNFDVDLWGWMMAVLVAASTFVGLLVMRYAPGGDGTMATIFAVPIALYGFMVAATWIDWVADKLVALLEYLGLVLRIPNYIMGLTILAWGNSMADLSANVTMARKGLANMAITACFAGPVFNILIGLGAGFGVLRNLTGRDVNYVSLSPAITTGFVFCFINCALLLVSGLAINKGVIPVGYGYAALALYAAYIGTSLLLQFLL